MNTVTRPPFRTLQFLILVALSGTALSLFASSAGVAESPADPIEDWLSLFNGRDLSGWTVKVVGSPVGADPFETFRVEDGILKVSYAGYDEFDNRFGHLFYQQAFGYYRLRFEYRFVGDQAPGGPGRWALRNSGVMVHAQSAESMRLQQTFPLSIEAQLLGGLSDGQRRPTGNVCTPGTHIVYSAAIHPHHCLYSSSPTLDGDQWVRFEVVVLGASSISHYVNDELVLEYQLPQYGGSGVLSGFDPALKVEGALLASGFIALQSESHPIEFRNIELLDLEGCMDTTSPSYRSYFVKSAPRRCADVRAAQ